MMVSDLLKKVNMKHKGKNWRVGRRGRKTNLVDKTGRERGEGGRLSFPSVL